MQREWLDGGSAESAASPGQYWPTMTNINRHSDVGIDGGHGIGAGLFDRAADRDDVGHVRRQLDQ